MIVVRSHCWCIVAFIKTVVAGSLIDKFKLLVWRFTESFAGFRETKPNYSTKRMNICIIYGAGYNDTVFVSFYSHRNSRHVLIFVFFLSLSIGVCIVFVIKNPYPKFSGIMLACPFDLTGEYSMWEYLVIIITKKISAFCTVERLLRNGVSGIKQQNLKSVSFHVS